MCPVPPAVLRAVTPGPIPQSASFKELWAGASLCATKGGEHEAQSLGEHCWSRQQCSGPGETQTRPGSILLAPWEEAEDRELQSMECLTFYLPGVFFVLVILLSFCGKRKSLIYSQSGEKHIPESFVKHIFHISEI